MWWRMVKTLVKRNYYNGLLIDFQSGECNGFLWDSSRNISLKDHGLLEKKVTKKGEKKDFARRPFIGYFKVSDTV